jgi:hypothetical protein
MSSDNFYVVRKHPSGGFTYVMGFASHDVNKDGSFNYDLPVRKGDPVFNTFDDALNIALADYSEYGVFTHPECEDEEINVKGWEGTE